MANSEKDLAMKLMSGVKVKDLWDQATERLASKGLLFNLPSDIELVVDEVISDFRSRQELAIKESLFNLVWPSVCKSLVHGIGGHYKARLAAPVAPEVDQSVDIGDSSGG